jgi:cytochrome c oxidase subunit II
MRIGRRRLMVAGAALLAAAGAGVLAQGGERVIKVTARKFVFTPNEIHLRKGEAVVLEFTTEDVFMGFSAPDFKVRMDIVPGRVNRLPFRPGLSRSSAMYSAAMATKRCRGISSWLELCFTHGRSRTRSRP